MKFQIYEKLEWHAGDPLLAKKIKSMMIELMRWLADKKLLTDEGLEILELGIDSGFSLHTRMLTQQGNEILSKSYDKWIESCVSSNQFIPPE
jgi:hypothetical protein